MDKQEYLNQISADNRPVAKSKSGIFSSKFFWIGIGAVVAFILMAILGGILSSNKVDDKDRISALILHVDNTSELIKEYQPSVRSSELRSYSSSLNSILSEASRTLTDYATEKYNFKAKDVKKSISEEETAEKDALESELFEAKITGTLDRVYAYEMAYEIERIIATENQILKNVKDDALKEKITKSLESLENLYNQFNGFSGTN